MARRLSVTDTDLLRDDTGANGMDGAVVISGILVPQEHLAPMRCTLVVAADGHRLTLETDAGTAVYVGDVASTEVVRRYINRGGGGNVTPGPADPLQPIASE